MIVSLYQSGTSLLQDWFQYSLIDGNWQLSWARHYEYDAAGNLVRYDNSPVPPNAASRRTTFSYQEAGLVQVSTLWSRNNLTTEWEPSQRKFYFYSPLSNAQQPDLQPIVIKLTPNPASDAVWLDTGGPTIQTVQVLDASGRVVRSVSNIQQNHWRLERNGLPAGLYRAQVRTERSSAVVSFIFE